MPVPGARPTAAHRLMPPREGKHPVYPTPWQWGGSSTGHACVLGGGCTARELSHRGSHQGRRPAVGPKEPTRHSCRRTRVCNVQCSTRPRCQMRAQRMPAGIVCRASSSGLGREVEAPPRGAAHYVHIHCQLSVDPSEGLSQVLGCWVDTRALPVWGLAPSGPKWALSAQLRGTAAPAGRADRQTRGDAWQPHLHCNPKNRSRPNSAGHRPLRSFRLLAHPAPSETRRVSTICRLFGCASQRAAGSRDTALRKARASSAMPARGPLRPVAPF